MGEAIPTNVIFTMLRHKADLVVLLVSVFSLVLASTAEPVNLGCPMPYRQVGQTCLFLDVSSSGSWHDMESICRSWQGHLVKIDDSNLLYDIIQFIEDEELTQDKYWIGATDEGQEGDWRWIDGTKVKMGTPFWGVNGEYAHQIQQPLGGVNENCAVIPKGYMFYFHDYSCSREFVPICEY